MRRQAIVICGLAAVVAGMRNKVGEGSNQESDLASDHEQAGLQKASSWMERLLAGVMAGVCVLPPAHAWSAPPIFALGLPKLFKETNHAGTEQTREIVYNEEWAPNADSMHERFKGLGLAERVDRVLHPDLGGFDLDIESNYGEAVPIGEGSYGWVYKITRRPDLHDSRYPKETDLGVYILMELAFGQLELKKDFVEYPLAKRMKDMQVVFQKVSEMEKESAVHCDLKPDNILFTDAGCPAIADFGLTMLSREEREGKAGTRGFMAPEIWHGTYTPKADVYSVGVMLYMSIFMGVHPTYKSVKEGGVEPEFVDLDEDMYIGFVNLVSADPKVDVPMLHTVIQELSRGLESEEVEQQKRELSEAVDAHFGSFLQKRKLPQIKAWLSERLVPLLKKMLARDPEKRITAAEAAKELDVLVADLRHFEPRQVETLMRFPKTCGKWVHDRQAAACEGGAPAVST